MTIVAVECFELRRDIILRKSGFILDFAITVDEKRSSIVTVIIA